MDALVAAFVAALLLQAGDRPVWLSAILADRHGAGGVIAGSAIALAVTFGVAALAGTLIAPAMSPNACQLLLALALVSGGSSGLFKLKPPSRFAESRGGGFLLSLIGLLALGMGDRTQFVAAALAARSPEPWLAAVGATLGSIVVMVAAALAGEDVRRQVPMRAFRAVTGIGFMVVGLIMALNALRLI